MRVDRLSISPPRNSEQIFYIKYGGRGTGSGIYIKNCHVNFIFGLYRSNVTPASQRSIPT